MKTKIYTENLPDFVFPLKKKDREVLCTIAGRITAIYKKEGEKVQEGEELARMESMKMEISIVAEVGGIISEIEIKEDDFVSAGQVLFMVQQECELPENFTAK